MTTLKTDICIVGAGPGGATTALKLNQMGIPCVLIDKATFPRDKICGDAISGKTITILNRINPDIIKKFDAATTKQVDIWGVKFVAPNTKEIDVHFFRGEKATEYNTPGYVSRRIDFDNLLIDEVKKCEHIDFYDNTTIQTYEKTDRGYIVTDKTGTFKVDCRLLIVADGAHSTFSHKIAGQKKDPVHHAGAVRAYYKNVAGMEDAKLIELHFVDEIVPGYFWIFPLPGGYANIGLGLRTDVISKRKVNLRKAMENIINHHPTISKRFVNAEREGKIAGYGLPFGSKKRNISGDHYMLIGDAGYLVDPLTGEGIGNAAYSGYIAAELAEKCLAENNFSAEFMKDYDVRVDRVLGSEMKISYQLQRTIRYKWLANGIANFITRNEHLKDVISRMYIDIELRQKLFTPLFWLKVLTGRKV